MSTHTPGVWVILLNILIEGRIVCVMPYRYVPCQTSETYHIFNRSVANQIIFINSRDYQRFLDLAEYYRFEHPPVRFSEYNRLSLAAKQHYFEQFAHQHLKLVNILAFCWMPNHFHMLLTQLRNGGIATFVSQIQNGYAKYFNIKTKRFGALFQSMFKAVRIETDEQLVHVARYIHLNPLSAGILHSQNELIQYRWSSFASYASRADMAMLDKTLLMGYYRNAESLQRSTFDQAEYQRFLFLESHLYHDIG